MTKLRAPLTFENALDRIAAQIGWTHMATVVDRKERTVRNWGDPDAAEQCPIDCARRLDIAYQQAGGIGSPLFETYALLVDQDRAHHFRDQVELSRRTIKVTTETAEAIAHLILAGQDAADATTRRDAVREVEEAVIALKETLPLLSEGVVPSEASGTVDPGGSPA